MTIEELISFISRIVSLTLVVVGLLVFVFKKYVQEWIKARFKSQLQKENEDYKQKFLKELESYKSGLLRELEDYKLNIDLKRNLALKYSDKKLEAYEFVSLGYKKIILAIITYYKLGEAYRSPFAEFKIVLLRDLIETNEAIQKYDFYIETFSVGLRLANLYAEIVKLLDKEYLAEWEEIDKVNHAFSTISSIMKDDLLGKEHSEKYLTDENINYFRK